MFGMALDSLTDEFLSPPPSDSVGEEDPRHGLVLKIKNSMGEIGPSHGSWEEAIEAYRRMRTFVMDCHPGLTLRLDHIIDTDGWGKTKHARICIDGVFAFFVYYECTHILSIGFSIASGQKALIGNVQAPKKTKGWGLERLPRERLAYVIELFQKAFAGYELYLVDGDSLMDRLIGDYRKELESSRKDFENAQTTSERDGAQHWIEEYERCIQHLTDDRPRLIAQYRKVGRFTFSGETATFGNLTYRRIAA